jgi:hypothetical protein
MSFFVAFLIFLLASVGMTHIVVDGNITEPFRRLVGWACGSLVLLIKCKPNDLWYKKILNWLVKKPIEMLDCHQCTGFWCGVICANLLPSDMPLPPNGWNYIVYGCASSVVSLGTAYYFTYLQARSLVSLENGEDINEH